MSFRKKCFVLIKENLIEKEKEGRAPGQKEWFLDLGSHWASYLGVKKPLLEQGKRVKLINPVSVSVIEESGYFSHMQYGYWKPVLLCGKEMRRNQMSLLASSFSLRPKSVGLINSGNSELWEEQDYPKTFTAFSQERSWPLFSGVFFYPKTSSKCLHPGFITTSSQSRAF